MFMESSTPSDSIFRRWDCTVTSRVVYNPNSPVSLRYRDISVLQKDVFMEPGGPVTRMTFGGGMSVRITFSSPSIALRKAMATPYDSLHGSKADLIVLR